MSDRGHNTTRIPDRAIRMELISYFSLYPDTVCTSDEMAERLDRDIERVKRQMEDLVGLCILRKSIEPGATRYSYLPPLSASLTGGKERHKGTRPRAAELTPAERAGRVAGDMGEEDEVGEEGEAGVSCSG
jgi:hypothetical protein